MSGVPGIPLRCNLYRYPSRCSNERTNNSGAVPLVRTARMVRLRCAEVRLSGMIHVREASDLPATRSVCSRRLKDKGSCRDSVRAVAKKSSTALCPSHAIERLFLSARAESSAYSPADRLMDNRGFDVGMGFPKTVLHLAAWCGTYPNMSIWRWRRNCACIFRGLDLSPPWPRPCRYRAKGLPRPSDRLE
jgi:hypothetical protein